MLHRLQPGVVDDEVGGSIRGSGTGSGNGTCRVSGTSTCSGFRQWQRGLSRRRPSTASIPLTSPPCPQPRKRVQLSPTSSSPPGTRPELKHGVDRQRSRPCRWGSSRHRAVRPPLPVAESGPALLHAVLRGLQASRVLVRCRPARPRLSSAPPPRLRPSPRSFPLPRCIAKYGEDDERRVSAAEERPATPWTMTAAGATTRPTPPTLGWHEARARYLVRLTRTSSNDAARSPPLPPPFSQVQLLQGGLRAAVPHGLDGEVGRGA